MTKNKLSQAGNTLIELMIASTIITLILVAVAISMMFSLKREALNRYQQTAIDLADEGVEFLGFERASLGWNDFVNQYGPAGGNEVNNWCFYQSETSKVVVASGQCSLTIVEQKIDFAGITFLRDVEIRSLTDGTITKLQATIIMRWWPDEQGERVYQLTHEFSQQDY